MAKPQRWQARALAAAAVLACLSATDVHALALGRLTVQSALGETLRAEIEVPEINAEEAASLRASVASPDAFRNAGLEYNPALTNLQVTLQRRADGRAFLRLTSDRVVNDPFVDLILEASWASGRIVRDYTLLLDPPSLRQAPAPAPQAAQVSPLPGAARPAPSAPAAAAASPTPAAPAVRPPTTVRTVPAAAAPRAPAPAGDGKRVTVQAGDTAGRIAAANKPASVSLDQMLVALLQTNPDAFIGGNVNRLRAGAVLDLPTEQEAAAIPAAQAGQMLVAQSRDFNEFRRRLAEGAPAAQVAGADRRASGRVEAKVEERKPQAATPDKLTLSKGAVQGKAAEDKIARERQAREASTRVAELSKNINELNRIGAASGAAGSTPAGAASAARGVSVPVGAASAARPASAPVAATPAAAAASARPASAPAPAAAAVAPAASVPAPAIAAASAASAAAPSASAAVAAASAPSPAAAASAPSEAASAPAPAATPASRPAPKPAPAPAPVETSWVDDLLDNPIVPIAALGLVALLGGFAFYRIRQRRKSTQVDSSFLESRLQPDSFFGASGGQRIDTNEGGATGSSMVYSPSQLDAAGDVDPVAEADVYLAYGRDLQAEEILKEAMRTNPSRVAIHGKLLEIYAKRRDTKAFEVVATEAYGLTKGEGPEWEHICELGRELDPANPLYQPGGQPDTSAREPAMTPAQAASFGASTIPQAAQPDLTPAPSVDLDLDLDFSLGDEPAAPPPAAPRKPEPTVAMQAQATQPMPSLDMDFGGGTVALPPTTPPAPVNLSGPDLSAGGLNFSTEPAPVPPPPTPAPAPAAAAPDAGMIEFDLGALSLDLGPVTESPVNDTGAAKLETGGEDPLATKLALAEEFRAIGDDDGARALVQEVVEQASGSTKAKAQKLLAELS